MIVYCLRNEEEPINMQNFREITTFGEMSSNVLADLGVLANDVIGPMLTNPQNQKGWPKIIKIDMKKHVDDLKAILHQLKGEMSSQVMLPLPTGVEDIYHSEARLKESDGEDVDLQLKTNIEGTIIKWAKQIDEILKEDSYIAFKRQKFPLPSADLSFYQQRLRNMEGIYSQLRDPRVKRMAHYLEETNSVYLACFKTMLTNVVAAIIEARDIYVYQRPLLSHFDNFEATEFADARPLIRPMLHCIGLLWGQSRYFCNVEKLIPLLRELCNLVIQQCTATVDPPTIFQGEPDEQLMKLKQAIGILNHFVDTYEVNRDKVATFFNAGVMPVRWSFDFDRVFMRFNVYLKRLRMIEEILEATVEFLKLEKVEFCGLRGKILSNECLKILDEYQLTYQYLGNISYDPADPEDESFLKDYKNHMKILEDVDYQLASLFSQGFDECYNLEHMFKFFQVIGDLFHRPIINAELQPKLPRLLELMHANLDDVKLIFDEEMQKLTKIGKGPERPMVDLYIPPLSGTLWWIHKLRQRLAVPMEEFISLEDPIVDSEDAVYMKAKHNEMLGYLNVLEDKQFKAWAVTVPAICKTHLAKNLIYRDPPFVRNNFSPELAMLLREIKYLKYLNKEGIPADGLELFNRNEKLQVIMVIFIFAQTYEIRCTQGRVLRRWMRRNEEYDLNRLNRAIAWYNAIREGSHETEVALIEKEIDLIDQLLGRGVQEFTWNNDFTDWMAEVYAAINTLQERVLTAQNNVRRGLSNIAVWGDKPLHNRKDNPDKKELLDIAGRHPRFVQRRNKILDSFNEFQEILKENYKLFFNIKDEDERAARAAKQLEIDQRRLQRQLEKEERQRIKAEAEAIKYERRERRRLKREAKAEEKRKRQELREQGEVIESPVEDEEAGADPEELADILAEREEMATAAFRAQRWPKYVEYVDGLVSTQIMKAIQTSLNLFEVQTNVETGPGVAFESVMSELRDPGMLPF
ncbi:dynein beta chain, ciliary [Phthorimaea operculella]|nr:dynein beta chain, ciliary [Phthorimaea operculella]